MDHSKDMEDNDVSIIDFNDSFTYNIVSSLYELGKKVKVVPYSASKEWIDHLVQEKTQKHVLIYGPGPGHPDDYKDIFPLVRKLLINKNIFQLGICLGHQIIWKAQGMQVVRSRKPLHGQKLLMRIPPFNRHFQQSFWGEQISVQFYNSWVIELNAHLHETKMDYYCLRGEFLIGSAERVLTYQFHPESVGTSCPSRFFAPIQNFLYN